MPFLVSLIVFACDFVGSLQLNLDLYRLVFPYYGKLDGISYLIALNGFYKLGVGSYFDVIDIIDQISCLKSRFLSVLARHLLDINTCD